MIDEGGTHDIREWGFGWMARHYAYFGRYSDMAAMRDSMLAFRWAQNDTNGAVETIAETAFWMVMGGGVLTEHLERKLLETANYNISSSHRSLNLLSYYYLNRGEEKRAREIRKDLANPWRNKEFDALVHYLSGEWQKALVLYGQLAVRYPRGRAVSGQMIARCLLELGKPDEALKELNAAQTTYSYSRPYMYPRGIHLRGKIYETLGDTASAIESYEEFLELWKDADENLPDLIDAKARLAQLKPAYTKP